MARSRKFPTVGHIPFFSGKHRPRKAVYNDSAKKNELVMAGLGEKNLYT